jgi:transaldolase
MSDTKSLKIKIFADGADKQSMLEMYAKPTISGLTTNPTLMRKSGISDYKKFCLEILETITNKPISFEVFSDDFVEMKAQALEISSWGDNVYVKIPITNTRGESSLDLVRDLVANEVKINVTAVFTLDQVEATAKALSAEVPSYVSIFAGRIADTGVDPIPLVQDALFHLKHLPLCEVIWASPREALNIVHANSIGCHVITVTQDLIKKMDLFGHDLAKYSLETVQMFFDDANAAGYSL